MTPISPGAWMKSFALHAAIVGLVMLVAYQSSLEADKQPRVLELVAGPGEDYAAREAPALGSESGVKLAIPKVDLPPAPVPTPTPPVPAPTPQPVQETTPIVPAPPPQPVKKEAVKTPPKQKEPDPAKDIAKQIKQNVAAAKRKAERDAAKERKKEQDRISKAEFDAKNAAKKVAAASAAKSSSTKFKPIDVKGIAGGVVGGSSASKAGAGGKALTREEGTLLELYDSEFLLKLRKAFEEDRPPGLSDSLKVTIEVRSNADGSLTSPRVTQPSGTPEFDKAVLEALRRVRMGPRPDRRSEIVSFVFTMREG